jgi:hypothetical protein
MPATTALRCRVEGCREAVLAPLAEECLCLDHFLERAFSGVLRAQEACNRGEPVTEVTLAVLLGEARHAARLLVSSDLNQHHGTDQQEKILEFLLSVAHLHEYAAHHPGVDPAIN